MNSPVRRLTPATLRVKSRSGTAPAEQATEKWLRTDADTYYQVCLKYPRLALFHSYPEFLHACLLEADPQVTCFIPQPYRLQVGKKTYYPDCYLVRGGERLVREIHNPATFPEAKLLAVSEFFRRQGITFELIDNATVLAEEIRARNWLDIIQWLCSATGWDTARVEEDLYDRITAEPGVILHDLVKEADPMRGHMLRTALYRLLHQGRVRAGLDHAPLDVDTAFLPCP